MSVAVNSIAATERLRRTKRWLTPKLAIDTRHGSAYEYSSTGRSASAASPRKGMLATFKENKMSIPYKLTQGCVLALVYLGSAEVQAGVPIDPKAADAPLTCPKRINGDRDFDAHGPRVEYDLQVLPAGGGRRLALEQYFHAKEVRGTSEAVIKPSLTTRGFYTFRDDQACTQVLLTSKDSASYHYTDTDHEFDIRPGSAPAGDLHQFLIVRGDTGNADIAHCTSDDTKYGATFNDISVELDTHPDCEPPGGGEAKIVEAEQNTARLIEQAMATIAGSLNLHIDNVDVAVVSGSTHTENQQSILGYTTPDGPVNDGLFMAPWTAGGRFTFYLDDIGTRRVSVEPDGGGFLFTISMEEAGTEIRSVCSESLRDPATGDIFRLDGLTPDEIAEGVNKGWQAIHCGLGGEWTVDLVNIEVKLRVFLDVDPASGEIYITTLSPTNPEQDVWVRATVAGMAGPCEGNVFAGQDDCMAPDEFELELLSMLQVQIGEQILRISETGKVWQVFNKPLNVEVKPPKGAFGVIVGDSDSGGSYGKVYWMVEE